jgi:hypothetical protein
MQRDDKQLLTEEMYLRVGELAAHFGRFDMYAKALLDLLTKNSDQAARNTGGETIELRGTAILRLMTALQVPHGIQDEFRRIDAEMRQVLSRHVIAAVNPAIIAGPVSTQDLKVNTARHPRDWFEQTHVDPAATQGVIRSLERDVVQVIALYLDLAELIRGIQNGVRFPERLISAVVPLAIPIVP